MPQISQVIVECFITFTNLHYLHQITVIHKSYWICFNSIVISQTAIRRKFKASIMNLHNCCFEKAQTLIFCVTCSILLYSNLIKKMKPTIMNIQHWPELSKILIFHVDRAYILSQQLLTIALRNSLIYNSQRLLRLSQGATETQPNSKREIICITTYQHAVCKG